MGHTDKVEEFLQTSDQFKLGELSTEKPHPLTQNLSTLANQNIGEAIDTLRQVDLKALELFSTYLGEIKSLHAEIQETFKQGGRLFLCGCGATGRLSLTLEALWREIHPGSEQVQAFMAGGDIALVHAIEGFEDYPEYGARQLVQKGFQDGDLLIASTEGGETPFVIGATLEAALISHRRPVFMYCNLTETLCKLVERSRRVLEDKRIQSICLFVGPMAITGSTRMQASTVLQLAIGLALFYDSSEILGRFQNFVRYIKKHDWSWLEKFVFRESEIYQNKEYIHYHVDEYAITTFTDTTERAPTFSLQAFNPLVVGKPQSLAYVGVRNTKTPEEAWRAIFNRDATFLSWDINPHLSQEYIMSFDFSESSFEKRKGLLEKDVHQFEIHKEGSKITFELDELTSEHQLSDFDLFFEHLTIKLWLNAHSTLVMGRLNRYMNNFMTWVAPSNGKLIDRASRYVLHLLSSEGIQISYEDVVRQLFKEKQSLKANESIVLKTFEALK